MATIRIRTYPDGERIPSSLPPAYQNAYSPDVPDGQRCSNCGYYDLVTGKCSKWNNAAVRPGYWCKAWEPQEKQQPMERRVY